MIAVNQLSTNEIESRLDADLKNVGERVHARGATVVPRAWSES